MSKDFMKDIYSETTKDLDQPINTGLFEYFKKGKLQCRIIYEDGSYIDYYKKFSKAYIITIKKRQYLVVPNCILKGKRSMITWFFNNPFPINFAYQPSKLKALDFVHTDKLKTMSKESKSILAKVDIDSESMNAMFNTTLIKGLYDKPGMTMKSFIIILIIIFIIILVMLQLTGQIDIMGALTGAAKQL